MNHPFHAPVLVDRVIEYLITDPGGIYIDGTLGGGGHAGFILDHLAPGSLYIGLDQDGDAIGHARNTLGNKKNIIIDQRNFAEIPLLLKERQIGPVNGLLLDLGISSFQIDMPQRGFSYLQSSPLDMRMDQRTDRTAADIINRYPEQDLIRVFTRYGEERFAKRIARRIVEKRIVQPITGSEQLRDIISASVPGRQIIKSFARIFQALRIEVNGELNVLERALSDCTGYIMTGGRIVVIAYHSLEDRIVKQFFRKQASPCICPPELPRCVCGREPVLKILTTKAVRAAESEISMNSRARSAVLRAAEVL
jgi:16S rRNA (cytosine1402-N4)-methyltransferase